jgi:hypothetical protein
MLAQYWHNANHTAMCSMYVIEMSKWIPIYMHMRIFHTSLYLHALKIVLRTNLHD